MKKKVNIQGLDNGRKRLIFRDKTIEEKRLIVRKDNRRIRLIFRDRTMEEKG